jgi:hypothetical protein
MLSANDGVIRKYLLDALDEQERERFEEAYFNDDELYEQMLATEEVLIDEFVCGKLPEAERRLFIKHYYATPERRERVEAARRLSWNVNHSWAAPEAGGESKQEDECESTRHQTGPSSQQ